MGTEDYFRVNVKAESRETNESITLAMYDRAYTAQEATTFFRRTPGIYVLRPGEAIFWPEQVRHAYVSYEPYGGFPNLNRTVEYVAIQQINMSVLSVWRVYAVPRSIVGLSNKHRWTGLVTDSRPIPTVPDDYSSPTATESMETLNSIIF